MGRFFHKAAQDEQAGCNKFFDSAPWFSSQKDPKPGGKGGGRAFFQKKFLEIYAGKKNCRHLQNKNLGGRGEPTKKVAIRGPVQSLHTQPIAGDSNDTGKGQARRYGPGESQAWGFFLFGSGFGEDAWEPGP